MCDPTLAITIGSAMFSAYGQYSQASAQAKSMKATAENNRRVAEYNATLQERNAEYQDKAAVDAQNRGADEAANARQKYRAATASARAQAAGAGLLVDTGTVGDIQDQNTTFGELNVQTALNNAEREAYGYKVKAGDYRAEATNLRLQGDVGVRNAAFGAAITKQGGIYDAVGTLVSGAGKAYDQYLSSSKTVTRTKAPTTYGPYYKI